jgi:Amt family ammonium transporter
MLSSRLKPLNLMAATAAIGIVGTSAAHAQEAAASTISAGDTAWLLISCALVMLMTPGLAFFYAGMVRRKNVVSTLFKNYLSLAVAGVLWAIVGL